MKTNLLLLIAALSLAGCATVTRGTKDALVVNSTPTGAQVVLSSGETCNSTPCVFKLPRKAEVEVTISKDGCLPQKVNVTNQIVGAGGAAMAGNVFVGGIIGVGVDASTGAMRDLVPNPVEVGLECRR